MTNKNIILKLTDIASMIDEAATATAIYSEHLWGNDDKFIISKDQLEQFAYTLISKILKCVK